MRKAEAPRAGWFPDPENRSRLRWWDGDDWSDIRRAPPIDAELLRHEVAHPGETMGNVAPDQFIQGQALSRQDTQQIITEVRNAARVEVDRAAEIFSQRAQNAARSITPLITNYTGTVMRWIRIAVITSIALLVAYFVFQVVAQASFFEWLGDRIDNLTNDDEGGLGATALGSLLVGAL